MQLRHNLYIYKADSTEPNDPRYQAGDLWGMEKIDANDAWDIATDSEIIVAVIDTGVDYTHPDLAANMWVNEDEYYGESGVDEDDNGCIDDIYGYDFCYDRVFHKPRDSDPMDDNGHGTRCAGTIGAVGDNNEGVTGVCWNVRIMAIKWLNWRGDGVTIDAVDAIKYAIKMEVDVLNNSWGGIGDDPLLKGYQSC